MTEPSPTSLKLPLRTPRLVLREYAHGDLDAVQAYASDPEVVRFMSWGPNRPEHTRQFLRDVIAARREQPRQIYEIAVVWTEGEGAELDAGTLVGGCGLRRAPDSPSTAELGYCFHRKVWGRGIATEAAGALVDFGFRRLRLDTVFATCDTENRASLRVLDKLSLVRSTLVEAYQVVRGQPRDHYRHEITREQWAQTNSNSGGS